MTSLGNQLTCLILTCLASQAFVTARQGFEASQEMFANSQPSASSSNTTLEPHSSVASGFTTSKSLGTQSSSCQSETMELRLENTESQASQNLLLCQEATQAPSAGIVDSMIANMDDDDDVIGSSQQESMSAPVLPGLGSTPSDTLGSKKRTRSPHEELKSEAYRKRFKDDRMEIEVVSASESYEAPHGTIDPHSSAAAVEEAAEETPRDTSSLMVCRADSNPSLPTRSRKLPDLRVPRPGVPCITDSQLDSTNSDSESPLARMIGSCDPHVENQSRQRESAEASNFRPLDNISADDEGSGSLNKPVHHPMDSANISVSPIECISGGHEGVRSRISSTPGMTKVMKKRVLTKQPERVVVSSDEEQDDRRKRKQTFAKARVEFKKPETTERALIIFGLSEELSQKIGKIVENHVDAKNIMQVAFNPNKASNVRRAVSSALGTYVVRASEGARAGFRHSLSDGSSTSSISKSSSTSGGYLADASSGCSISDNSKRDKSPSLPGAVSSLETSKPPSKKIPQEVEQPEKFVITDQEGQNVKSPMGSIRGTPETADSRRTDEKASNPQENLPECKISQGSSVFAKFCERTQYRYWPAKVKEKTVDGKWNVEFDDGKERHLPEDEMIPASSLLPGHEVHVVMRGEDAGVSQIGKLVSFPDMSQDIISYHIHFAPIEGIAQVEERLVSIQDVFVTVDQAKVIKGDLGGIWTAPSVSNADIDLGNILNTPRVRQKPSKFVASSTTIPSKTKDIPAVKDKVLTLKRKKGGEHVETSCPETDTETTTTSDIKHTVGDARKMVRSSDETSPKRSLPLKRKYKRRGSKDRGLFNGMHFLLTQGTRLDIENDDYLETETEEDSDHYQSLEEDCNRFSRSELRNLISENGGTVLDAFPGSKEVIPKELIVLSDRACETMTFLLAVTYGFPRVNYLWVKDSVMQNKSLDMRNYFLPVGKSKVPGRLRVVECHEIGSLKTLMKEKNILITSKSFDFISDWKQLLTRLGADVCSRTKGRIDRMLRSVDIVVADSESPETVIKDAVRKEIPIVSSKWIMQSLINGEVLDTAMFKREHVQKN